MGTSRGGKGGIGKGSSGWKRLLFVAFCLLGLAIYFSVARYLLGGRKAKKVRGAAPSGGKQASLLLSSSHASMLANANLSLKPRGPTSFLTKGGSKGSPGNDGDEMKEASGAAGQGGTWPLFKVGKPEENLEGLVKWPGTGWMGDHDVKGALYKFNSDFRWVCTTMPNEGFSRPIACGHLTIEIGMDGDEMHCPEICMPWMLTTGLLR